MVLFDSAGGSYPAAPAPSRPLHYDDLVRAARAALRELGYGLIPPPGRLPVFAPLRARRGGLSGTPWPPRI